MCPIKIQPSRSGLSIDLSVKKSQVHCSAPRLRCCHCFLKQGTLLTFLQSAQLYKSGIQLLDNEILLQDLHENLHFVLDATKCTFELVYKYYVLGWEQRCSVVAIMPSIYATLHTKFERNRPNSLRDMCSWKGLIFFTFFLFFALFYKSNFEPTKDTLLIDRFLSNLAHL